MIKTRIRQGAALPQRNQLKIVKNSPDTIGNPNMTPNISPDFLKFSTSTKNATQIQPNPANVAKAITLTPRGGNMALAMPLSRTSGTQTTTAHISATRALQ